MKQNHAHAQLGKCAKKGVYTNAEFWLRTYNEFYAIFWPQVFVSEILGNFVCRAFSFNNTKNKCIVSRNYFLQTK